MRILATCGEGNRTPGNRCGIHTDVQGMESQDSSAPGSPRMEGERLGWRHCLRSRG